MFGGSKFSKIGEDITETLDVVPRQWFVTEHVRENQLPLLREDQLTAMKRERAKLSRHNEVAKAMDYMLKRLDVFTRFLEDGRICLSNNAAERELRGIALGRKSWLFAGSDRGGERAAVMLTLISNSQAQ